MLNKLNELCQQWHMSINLNKTNVLDFSFFFVDKSIKTVDRYKYLGVTLKYNLEFSSTSEVLADEAGRALDAIIENN